MVRGNPVAPVVIANKLHARFTLQGREGLAAMAISGVDVALWDALARAVALPPARLLGGGLRPVPAYNSNGLGLPEKLADAGFGMSSHLTPTAHFLEHVDWASPILARPLEIADGQARPDEAAGVGLEWNEEAVAGFALE